MNAVVKVGFDAVDEELISDLGSAADKLLSASEQDFQQIKEQGWWGRLIGRMTFSDESGRRVAAQVGSLTQAQICVIKLLAVLSETQKGAFDVLKVHAARIEDISSLVGEVVEAIEAARNKIDDLEERWRLKSINTIDDYKGLPVVEKGVFLSVLDALADRFEKISREQQDYLNYAHRVCGDDSLQRSTKDPVAEFSNIENRRHATAIMTSCLIYIALRDPEAATKGAEEFIGDLDFFTTKKIDEITKSIEAIKAKRGIDAFMPNNSDYQLNESISIELFLDVDASDVGGEAVGAEGSYYDEDAVREELVLNDAFIIREGDERRFVNKDIEIRAKIICRGSIVFEGCRIRYGTKEDGIVFLGEKASLKLMASMIEQIEGYEGMDDNWLFDREGNSIGHSIEISGCTLINCSSLARVREASKFKIDRSYFRSPGYIFDNEDGKIDAIRSYFDVKTRLAFARGNFRPDSWFPKLIASDYSFDECQFDGGSGIIKIIIESRCQFSVSHCYFYGVAFGYREDDGSGWRGSFDWVDCKLSISSSMFRACRLKFRLREGSKLEGNNFLDCWDMFKGGSSEILDCQFIGCTGIAVGVGDFTFDLCSFIDTKTRMTNSEPTRCPIVFDKSPNYIKKCDFNGFDGGDRHLIGFESGARHQWNHIQEACVFKNIKTDNEIIQRSVSYQEDSWLGLSSETKYSSTVQISDDCTGYDRKWESGRADNLRIREKTSHGEVIGVTKSFPGAALPEYSDSVSEENLSSIDNAPVGWGNIRSMVFGQKNVPFLSDEWFSEVSRLTSVAGNLNIPAAFANLALNLTVSHVGGNVEMALNGGNFQKGHVADAPTTLTLPGDLLRKIFLEEEKSSIMRGFISGQVKVEGDMSKLMSLQTARTSEEQKALFRQILTITD